MKSSKILTDRQTDRQTILFCNKKISFIIKGIAAICVVLGHYLINFPPYIRMLFPGHLWVGVFFFYSGFGLQYSYNTKPDYLNGFIKNKAINILIPFLFAETIYTVFSFAFVEKTTFLTFLLNCFGIPLKNGTLWFVSELLVLYALFYLEKRFLGKLKYAYLMWLVAFAMFFAIAVYKDISNSWYMSSSAFLIGYYFESFRKFIINILSNRALRISAILFHVLTDAVWLFIRMTEFSAFGIRTNMILTAINIINVPAFLLFVMAICSYITNTSFCDNKILVLLGSISYEIYLYHMLGWLITSLLFENIAIRIIVSLLITFVCALFANRAYKKITNNV